jgi:hypothetical protein
MTVDIFTVNEDGDAEYIEGVISSQWISAAWIIPDTNEYNLIVGGFQLTVIGTDELRNYLKTL